MCIFISYQIKANTKNINKLAQQYINKTITLQNCTFGFVQLKYDNVMLTVQHKILSNCT